MDFRIENTPRGLRLALRGRLTFAENGDFRGVLARLCESAAPIGRVEVDLGDVEFIDSAGLGLLLQARDAVRKCQGDIALVEARGQVNRMLGLVCYQDLFAV